MSTTFARTDHSVLGRWWWTVDRWMLMAIALISTIGVFLIQAASPSVATRIGLDNFHFIQRHLLMLLPALAVMFIVSLLSPRGVRRFALLIYLLALVGTALTLVVGVEIKGATRWIHLPGMSVQPSEFLKPAFAVVAAWLFAKGRADGTRAPILAAAALYGLTASLLLMQPDLGMTFVLSAVWFGQFFLAGLPLLLVAVLVVFGVSGLAGAYFILPHVQSRVNRFLDPAAGDNYQIQRSLEAFGNGGLWGTGPGQGTVKMGIPDAHADFIFAVAGEELGLLWCLIIIALFTFVVLRGFGRIFQDQSLFVLLAGGGLLMQFGLQALINMASSLHMMPTKGMTLPFISYGGSSLIALGLGVGMVLALSRKRFGPGDTI